MRESQVAHPVLVHTYIHCYDLYHCISLHVYEGRKLVGGRRIDVRSGHFNENWKPEDFDIYQVFLSPSIRYAGINAYAKPNRYVCINLLLLETNLYKDIHIATHHKYLVLICIK